MASAIVRFYRLHEFVNGKWIPASDSAHSNRETAELKHGNKLQNVARYALVEVDIPIVDTLLNP